MRDTILICGESAAKAIPYVEALQSVGVRGEQIHVVTPQRPPEHPERIGAEVAGLVVCGGPDIHPGRYGEEPIPEVELHLDPQLDELEWEVLSGAVEARTPTWAICRGLQMVNVFLGGSLYQDLQLQLPGAECHYFRDAPDHLAHDLRDISTETSFGETLGRDAAWVNSRHHQGIKDLAPGLRPVAWSPDGVLEVIETESDDWWMRGVQWHPEDIASLPLQRKLWEEFAHFVSCAEVREPEVVPRGAAAALAAPLRRELR